jgi:NAD(P)-dependent dehydrogenase (short-subunit alcohol dehydrogenase family)
MASRAAVVTGGGSGIGKAIAVALAAGGVAVHLVGRSARVEAAAREIVRTGGVAAAHRGSVSDEEFARGVVAGIENAERRLELLVNAAAVLGPVGEFAAVDLGQFADVLQTNLLGTATWMRCALPGMLARGFGRIVNFAGGGAAYAYPRFSGYAASKCAVVRLTETVAAEIEIPNVTVNVIAPGAVETEILAQVRRHGGEVRTVTAVGEAVRLVTFLASPRAAGINGRFLHVRDRWSDPALFSNPEMLKLRRLEAR